MRKWIVSSLVVVLVALASCNNEKPKAAGPATPPEDAHLTTIKTTIAKTTPDEKAMIEKCLAMKPEVNGLASAKTLGEITDDYGKNKADYNIHPIGWEAHIKSNKRWKVLFHYQDYQKQFTVAEWEYNPETSKLYPFDLKNAPQFWTGVGADQSAKKGK
jgi:hypothetical protein